MSSAMGWLLLNMATIGFLAFYSMVEMACVSFNKVRLHYYVATGNQRAKWLHYLLDHPFRLFGTTLVGVNVAMVVGSECARQFHSALGINPDLAPLTQVAIVVIFGELAPMFAARHYAENVAMMGVPLVYFSAKILTPALLVIGWVTKGINFLIKGKTTHSEIFLSQEELENILEETADRPPHSDVEDFNAITRNIFSLRHKTALDVLTSLHEVARLPSHATVAQMKNLVKRADVAFSLIYFKKTSNIVGVAFPRDLIRVPDSKRVRDYARAPWFVTENTPLTQILQQFQKNNQSLAVILDKQGNAAGVLTLDDLVAEIFGESSYKNSKEAHRFVLERTFSGDSKVGEFNKQFGVSLKGDDEETLAGLMKKYLGRQPEEGDAIFIDPFELIVKESSLLDAKKIVVKSRLK